MYHYKTKSIIFADYNFITVVPFFDLFAIQKEKKISFLIKKPTFYREKRYHF